MVEMDELKAGISVMAGHLSDMLQLIEKGFMEHKEEYLSSAMDKEREINEMEKSLTKKVMELSRKAKCDKERKALVVAAQVIETLERMGDEASSLLERIEVKNAEHLLFSDLGVAQYNETYDAMKRSVDMMRDLLGRGAAGVKDHIIDNGFAVKELVERYRHEHMERLVKGVCTPIAANMLFDMLDFTGNLARHASNIAKLF
jgi:phosphate:Na+ symporter